MRISFTQNRGFTLIEALIAIFILSVGILTVAKLQGASVKGDAKAGNLTWASLMASGQIEELIPIDFCDDILDAGGNPHYPTENCEEKFCVAWTVIDDMPLPPRTQDTDDESPIGPISTNSGITVTKTVRVYVYKNETGFNEDDPDTQVLHMSFIKSRSIGPNLLCRTEE